MRELGLAKGVRAAGRRLRACRPGYSFVLDDGGWAVCCADGTMVLEEELSDILRLEVASVRRVLPGGFYAG